MKLLTRLRWKWETLPLARRDMVAIAGIWACGWYLIERSNLSGSLFQWIAANPRYELDSLLLALILAAIGVAWFALRRYTDLQRADAARDRAERDYQALAQNDSLTGLPNRRALNDRLESADRGEETVGLILLDLDRFKGVNDLHGHGAGDRLLQLVSQRIEDLLCLGQQCYRLGGDEFAVIVPESGRSTLNSENVARRIIRSLSHPFEDSGLVHHIGGSAGIAHHPADGCEPASVMRAADLALYRAKEKGRGRFCCFEAAMDEQIRRRALLEQQMRRGIPAGEFVPHFQPLVALATGEVVGYELLARWERKDGREVPPEMFIPVAEECGLINDLMFSMLDLALRAARGWPPHLTIEVNISPSQLRDPWISERLLATLARNNFPAARFGIEITEDAILADEQNVRRVIQSLKNQGARIALDDFGTGYSSLHHLRTLPLDRIKIDRSFICDLKGQDEGVKIVRAIIGLASSLDLPVTAEGIETAELAQVLREMGCTHGQGYFFGRPEATIGDGQAETDEWVSGKVAVGGAA